MLQISTSRRWRRLLCGAGACIAFGMTHAAVNDILPGDYFPLAQGTSTLALYLYDREGHGPYVNGSMPLRGRLDTQIVALRLSHFFDLGGMPLSLVAVLPWASAETSPAPLAAALGRRASGMGDIRLGATRWLLADRARGDYLAVSALVSLPTGEYEDRQAVSIGENRSKFTLNFGWIKTLSPLYVVELIPEVAWYGTNDDYLGGNRLEQKPSVALTGHLRYRATPHWQFHVGGQWNAGGETRVNGVDRNDAPETTRLMLGTTYVSDDRKNQWILRFANDVKTNNGFETRQEILLRYLRLF